jgi:hypothetical protein
MQRLAAAALVCGAVVLGNVLPALAVWGIVLAIFAALTLLERQEQFRAAMQRDV